MDETGNNNPILTVSELSAALKRAVEQGFDCVRLRGEVSGVSRPRSGHIYLALKDEQSVMDAICWRGKAGKLAIQPEDGLDVIVTGHLTTYAARSKYQLIIDTMELAGEGALLKQLEERRKKLLAEGLFDPARKKPIPALPHCIGIITSPSGAVIRDILHRLADRFPRPVVLWPVPVQGTGAAEQIAAAIAGMNTSDGSIFPRPDLIIVARGGGSLEDLMAFNEEITVRAAAASAIPLISAVGHETDTTLIDHAADLRAPTPTAAAEMAVPVRAELLSALKERETRLLRALFQRVTQGQERLDALTRPLAWPQRLLERHIQRLDDLSARLRQPADLAQMKRDQLIQLQARLQRILQSEFQARMQLFQHHLARLRPPMAVYERDKARLEARAQLLASLSHENVLKRGYALIRDAQGHVIASAAQAPATGEIEIAFHDDNRKALLVSKNKDRKEKPSPPPEKQGQLL